MVPPPIISLIFKARGASFYTKVIFTIGYNNLPFWFLIVLGTIIEPSPSINPAKYPPSKDDEEESKEDLEILFNFPTL